MTTTRSEESRAGDSSPWSRLVRRLREALRGSSKAPAEIAKRPDEPFWLDRYDL